MNVPKFNMSRTSHEMEGRLYDTEGNVVNPCDGKGGKLEGACVIPLV